MGFSLWRKRLFLGWILPCGNGEQLKCPLLFFALIGVLLETLQAEFPSFAAIQGFPLKGCPRCDRGLLAAFLTRSLPPRVTAETVTPRGTPHFWARGTRGSLGDRIFLASALNSHIFPFSSPSSELPRVALTPKYKRERERFRRRGVEDPLQGSSFIFLRLGSSLPWAASDWRRAKVSQGITRSAFICED